MKKRISLSAVLWLALMIAYPAQAVDWFDSLFGPGLGGGDPGVDPTLSTSTTSNETVMGPGGGGGDPPGVDPE